MIPGENDVPPVRPGVPPIVENPVTETPLPEMDKSVPPPPVFPEDFRVPPKDEEFPDLETLPRPKFPQVGRIPEAIFEVQSTPRALPTFPPHAFYCLRNGEGVTIWPGVLVTYIDEPGGTNTGKVWVPDGLTMPMRVSAGEGDLIGLQFDVFDDPSGMAPEVSNVQIVAGALSDTLPAFSLGGTATKILAEVTSTGVIQRYFSDFTYIGFKAPPA